MINLRFSLRNLYRAIPTLFDKMVLPAGYDKQFFIDTLLDGYGDFGIARMIEEMPQAIGIWSRRKAYTLEGLMASTQMEYNPIENYDRMEDSTDTANDKAGEKTTDNSKDKSGEKTSDNSKVTGTGSGTNQTSRAGMETDKVKLDEENKGNSTSSTTQTGSRSADSTAEHTATRSADSTAEHRATHTARLHGNIGVTTTQQMLEEERRVRLFDVYTKAAQLFADDLLIYVYL